MISSINHHMELRRMEDACRQTRHQIDMIERQIIRKSNLLLAKSSAKRSHPVRPIQKGSSRTAIRSPAGLRGMRQRFCRSCLR